MRLAVPLNPVAVPAKSEGTTKEKATLRLKKKPFVGKPYKGKKHRKGIRKPDAGGAGKQN